MHEKEYWDKAGFVTLTYNDEHIPLGETLVKKDLRNFFKRLRKNTGLKIKFFASGEYGEKYDRPHYHAIIFGIDPSDHILDLDNRDPKRRGLILEGPVLDAWTLRGEKLGDCTIGVVTSDSARYVAGYIHKKFGVPRDFYKSQDLETPFQAQSRGLGLQFALDNKSELENDLGFTVKGVHYGLPRYYTKQLDLNNASLIREATLRQIEVYFHWRDKGMITKSECDRMIKKARKQRNLNLEGKQKMRSLTNKNI